jgi:hypothetical protein
MIAYTGGRRNLSEHRGKLRLAVVAYVRLNVHAIGLGQQRKR